MLVLSRRNNQSVVIGGSAHFERMVKVTVLGIGDGSVKLGFEADQDVPVHREEVWERILTRGQSNGPVARPVAQSVGGPLGE